MRDGSMIRGEISLRMRYLAANKLIKTGFWTIGRQGLSKRRKSVPKIKSGDEVLLVARLYVQLR